MKASKSSVHLKEAVRHLESLPAMPAIAQRILSLDLETDEGEHALLGLIAQDPQIAAKIIGLANTPLFGASRRVTAVSDAAILLGLTRVKAVALGIAVISSLTRASSAGGLDVQKFWLHSLGISLGMRVLSRAMPAHLRPLDDEVFLAGLLHDIGYMVLNHLNPVRSAELHAALAASEERPSIAVERELLELTHCELGAELARYWSLPEMIVAVILHHHADPAARPKTGRVLANLVSLTEELLPALGIAERGVPQVDPAEWLALGIDPQRAPELTALVLEQAQAAREAAAGFR